MTEHGKLRVELAGERYGQLRVSLGADSAKEAFTTRNLHRLLIGGNPPTRLKPRPRLFIRARGY